MLTSIKVVLRIAEIESRLEFLDNELTNEMKKNFRERKNTVLELIYRERVVYQFALAELKDLINDEVIPSQNENDL